MNQDRRSLMKLIASFFLFYLVMLCLCFAIAESVPKSQEGAGGELYSIELPRGIELYSNARLQRYLFLVDFDSKGEVIAVHLRDRQTVNRSHNGRLLSEAIKKMEGNPIRFDGDRKASGKMGCLLYDSHRQGRPDGG